MFFCSFSGNYFYLIIDHDDEGEETVHFLNQVDEADLLSLMDEEDVEEYEASLSEDKAETEEVIEQTETVKAEIETEISEAKENEDSIAVFIAILLLIVVLVAGGGFFVYTKVKSKKEIKEKPDPDADYDEEEDYDDYSGEYEDEPSYSSGRKSDFEEDESVFIFTKEIEMNRAEQIKRDNRKRLIGKLFVIAIGINEYKNKNDNLNNCCTDAESIFETIKTKDYFSMDNNSILITSDTNCTEKQNILDGIKTCEKFIDENTNIIFFYSGHGCNINEKFYFLPSDSELPENNLISIDDIINILSGMNGGRYKSITLLIDACQKQIKHDKSLEKQSYNFLNEYIDDAKGVGIIYSCSKGEYSLDEFNKHNISVFTYLVLQALNGHKDAVDANYLTFNKLYEFLKIESRKISRESIQINQHPQILFEGKDIVYAYIPDDSLHDKDIEIDVYSYDELFMDAMFHLQNSAALVYYAEDIDVDCFDHAYMVVPSEKFIRQVCEELFRKNLLSKYLDLETLSNAFTYMRLIDLKSTESLRTSVKRQIIADVESLYNDLDSIYDSCINRIY